MQMSIEGGRLLQGHSFLRVVSGSANPLAFLLMGCSQHLGNQTRSKVGEVDKPTLHITYPVLAVA